MKNYLAFSSILVLSILFAGCDKGHDEIPQPTYVSISNLTYTPTIVSIIPYLPKVIINGSIDFKNAQYGVTSIRLTTSGGSDLTIQVDAGSQTSGTLMGSFEVEMPVIPGLHTFRIWIVDGKGNNSNTLTGMIQMNVNDAATSWVTMSQQYALRDVIWKNGMFIAVGDNGMIISSPNGALWTSRSSGVNYTLHSICWAGNKYVIVGSNNTILTSADGITWTKIGSVDNGIHLFGVSSHDNQVVAVGKNLTDNKTMIMLSPDGNVWWRNEFYEISGGELTDVTWGDGKYVAIGKRDGLPLIITSDNTNIVDWVDRSPSNSSPVHPSSITWSGSRYALTGYSVTGYSDNGIIWTMNYNPGFSAPGLIWSTNKFVAVALDGIYTSPDGVTWTKSADIPYSLKSITWSGTQYIAVGFISPVIMSSP